MSNVEALQSKMSKSMEEAAITGALVGEKYTKEGAPVDTGNLRRSYATQTESKSDDQVVVRTGTDVIYSGDQEFGTSKMPGKPHLRPGFENHKSEILSAATSKLKV
jgi:HK97 gp10 family phage protein